MHRRHKQCRVRQNVLSLEEQPGGTVSKFLDWTQALNLLCANNTKIFEIYPLF
jgi:hypothetical protein